LYRNQSIKETTGTIVEILTPLILGAVFAYIMKSTCNSYEKLLLKGFLKSGKRNPKKAANASNIIAVILTYITWFAAISLLLWIAVPQIIQSVTKFVNEMIVKIPEYITLLVEWEQTFLKDHEMLRPYFDKVINGLIEWSNTDLIPQLQTFVSTSLLPWVLKFAGSIMDIVIGLVISVFLLLGRKKLANKSLMLLHCIFKKDKSVKIVVDEFKYADQMFSGFLEGKIIDSALVGFIYFIVLEIMNVPYAPLVAVICGVTNIIPIFGPFIGAIPSGFIILTADPIKVIPFVIFVFVIQFLDGYIIDPHIVGGNINISSFNVIFAVLLFGGLWGFAGLLVGVPTFAVIYDIGKKLTVYILKKRGKQDVIDKYCEKDASDEAPKVEKNEPIPAEGEPVSVQADAKDANDENKE
jgi:predicted PurR-regulated permease PerM